MKTFFKILLVVVLLLLIALIVIPMVYKDKIIERVKVEVNKNLRADVDWDDFSLSLFKGFPDMTISLDNLSVVGVENFKGDTLVAFDKFNMSMDLFSLFSDKIKIKTIVMDNPVVRAIVLEDGSVNWDITYPSEEIEEPEDTSAMEMVISLQKFEVINGSVAYIDKELDMAAWLNGLDFIMKGDLSDVYSDLSFNSTTESFTFEYEGMKYINNGVLSLEALIGADLDKFEFTFKDNYTKLNELEMVIEGMFGMPNDEDMTMDLKFHSRESTFKSLLSVVPAVYTEDFAGLKTSGTFSLDGSAIGTYNEKEMPKVAINLLVNDGYFAYPDLPKAVEKVAVDFKMFYDGVFEDNTTVDINKFYMEIGGNPIDMRLRLKTPMSDMQMTGALKGRFDLASLSDVFPLDDMNLGGRMNIDLEVMGKLSDLENEKYEDFKADGLFELMDIKVSGNDVPVPVDIKVLSMMFSPQFVNLSSFDAKLGNSDIQLKGRLENFIPYVFSDKTIKGTLDFTSSRLDLNELMTDTGEEETVDDTTALSVVEIPKNIDFVFTSSIKSMLYDEMEITDVLGKIVAREGILSMENLSMNLLKGSMIMSGQYNTQDIVTPMVDFDFKMSRIDIPSAFNAFNTVEKLAPIAENCVGNVSVDFKFTSFLDSTMSPVISSITGKGRLRSDDIEIVQNQAFDKIAALLKNDKLKNPRFKDVNLSFEMRNGRVYVDPFDTKIGTTDLNIGGDQGIDQTMNYFINMSIPRKEFGAAANDLLEGLAAQAAAKGFDVSAGDKVNVQLKITGSFSDPKIGMDVKENMQKAKAEIKEAVKERVQDEVKKVVDEGREIASEEIDRIMRQAEEEAEKIRQTAEEAGQRLIGEAELQGKNLIKEAGSNPLKRVAAQKASDEMIKKAKQQAANLNKEADQKANVILEEAQKRADALKNK
jgi:vacuolar-type H+-ATPase subunit H